MKGYNKSLKAFIEYVFDKYGEDQAVQDFQCTYYIRQREKETRREQSLHLPVKKYVRITTETAQLCKDLVMAEQIKCVVLKFPYTEKYSAKLDIAYEELKEGCDE